MDEDILKKLVEQEETIFNNRQKAIRNLNLAPLTPYLSDIKGIKKAFINKRRFNVKNKFLLRRVLSWMLLFSQTFAFTNVYNAIVASINQDALEKKEIYLKYKEAIDSYQILIHEIAILLNNLGLTTATEHYVAIMGLIKSKEVSAAIPTIKEFARFSAVSRDKNIWGNADFITDVMRACGFEAYSVKNSLVITNNQNTHVADTQGEEKYLIDNSVNNNDSNDNPIYNSNFHRYTFVWENGQYKVFDPVFINQFDITGFNKVEDIDGQIKSTFNLFDSFIDEDIDLNTMVKMITQTILERKDEPDIEQQQEIIIALEKIKNGNVMIEIFRDRIFTLTTTINKVLDENSEHSNEQEDEYEKKI